MIPVTWTAHHALPAGVKPFYHFDRDGQIAFQGGAEEGSRLDDLPEPRGTVAGCAFDVPPGAPCQTAVHAGWRERSTSLLASVRDPNRPAGATVPTGSGDVHTPFPIYPTSATLVHPFPLTMYNVRSHL